MMNEEKKVLSESDRGVLTYNRLNGTIRKVIKAVKNTTVRQKKAVR